MRRHGSYAIDDRELIERLATRVKIETSCGNRTENPRNHVRLMDEAKLRLESLLSDRAKLEERVRENLHGLLQIVAGVVEMGDPAYERAGTLLEELEAKPHLEKSLTDELSAYCTEHNLPNMSADELFHECWAVRYDEKSNFIAPATTHERRKELSEAMDWLSDFIERWDAAVNP